MITDIRLQHFRSYGDDSFEFSPGVNIIVGPNASGKTNLLEAILMLARGSSYRAKDNELIGYSDPWARLDARLGDIQRTVKLTREPVLTKTYELDGKTLRRMTLAHSLPVVLFEPNHLQLLHSGPEQRRNYLDGLLEQIRPGFVTLRLQYRRTLAQRNALLKKSGPHALPQLFPWDVRLSELAGTIVRAREELVTRINTQLNDLYGELSRSTTTVAAFYQPQFAPEHYESELLKKLEHSAHVDVQRGFTAAGPHREDFVVLMDGHPVPDTASRGETRTIILALKIIELQILEEARGSLPLLLLDDVFSELDGARRHALTDHLKYYQTFITTTDADVVLKHFAKRANVIPIGSDK